MPGGLGELHHSTPQEKRVLEHFQSQFLSTMQTKTAKYSFVAGIMHICKSSPVLMHMMMAIVGHQASGLYESREEQLFAIDEYRQGLAGFATLVGSGQYERHTLLAAFWILIQFEMRFGQKPRDITHHLDGFNRVIMSHGPSLLPQLIDTSKKNPDYDPSQTEFQYPFRTPLVTYKNVVNRLGLWIAYLDACASTFDLGGAVMATMQYKYPGSLDRIFAHSRDALKDLWGEEYPRQQEMDDIQNRPAFDLFHHCHILRFKVSELRRDKSVGHRRSEKIRDLHAEIQAIAEVGRQSFSLGPYLANFRWTAILIADIDRRRPRSKYSANLASGEESPVHRCDFSCSGAGIQSSSLLSCSSTSRGPARGGADSGSGSGGARVRGK
jgi:hypothetical protein